MYLALHNMTKSLISKIEAKIKYQKAGVIKK